MYLEKVPEEKAFVIDDKKILTLKDLHKELKKMNDEQYSHYANMDHNYFADWINAVIGHEDLAKQLRKKSSKKDAIKTLSLEINILEKPKEEIIEKEDEIVIVEDKKPEIVDDKVEPKKSSKKTNEKKKTKKTTSKKTKKEPEEKEEEPVIETSEEEKIEEETEDKEPEIKKEEEEEITEADFLEVEDMLKKISTEKQEVKHLLWKHFAWDMAKEFMYGLAIGIFVGLILSRILLP